LGEGRWKILVKKGVVGELQMSDFEDSQLLRTPGRGKRRQRVSDVIDSMGERADLGSPAIAAHHGTATTTSASAPGFVTPQRTNAYWNLAVRSALHP
jgi:hypothetical protein